MTTQCVDVAVLVDGQCANVYHHNNKVYVAAKMGSEYSLRFRNKSNGRIQVVASVDGLSIMNGKPGSISDSGYIVEPFSSVDIPGWRLNNSEVAKFKFGASSDSYAAKITHARNIGVIGVAAYRQRGYVPISSTWTTPRSPFEPKKWTTAGPTFSTATWEHAAHGFASATKCAIQSNSCTDYDNSESAIQSAGTVFGDSAQHMVVGVDFTKEAAPTDRVVIYYDTIESLRARGVPVDFHEPNPFPADAPIEQGCMPPAGWCG